MERMTLERVNGIKTGYWSPKTKEELVQRLAEYENTGLTPMEIKGWDGLGGYTVIPNGLERCSPWISTEDRLPETGELVIIARIYDMSKPMRVEQAILMPGGWWKVHGTNLKKVHYWMPLPEPPEVPR